MAIKKILISQARPESEKSPYFDLEKKHKVALHFHPLIQLVPIAAKDFRKNKKMPMQRDSGEYSVFSFLFESSPNIESQMITEQVELDLTRLIDELPEDQKEVLMMSISHQKAG